jgi:hypothetical protein
MLGLTDRLEEVEELFMTNHAEEALNILSEAEAKVSEELHIIRGLGSEVGDLQDRLGRARYAMTNKDASGKLSPYSGSITAACVKEAIQKLKKIKILHKQFEEIMNAEEK